MEDYRHVLVALDASPESRQVLQRGARVATLNGARLSVLQVVEYPPIETFVESMPIEPVEEIEVLENRARESLQQMVAKMAVDAADIVVIVGAVRDEIVAFAKEKSADLIVVGSRERHGLALLWASTTDSIVHRAPCDVLAVHAED